MVKPEYPEKDFPWTFYFNGVAMPKWGGSWPSFGPEQQSHWDWEVGPRDFYIISGKISKVGTIESASPHIFIYAVQEMLCLLLTEREGVLQRIRDWKRPHTDPLDVYAGLVETAFQMRDRAKREGLAFWTSGYEEDRLRLVEAMRCSTLDGADPEYDAPPHVKSRLTLLQQLWRHQIKTLHTVAGTKSFSKTLRKKLLEL